jgi:two-component system chemotaxis response regulator CheB
MKILIADGSVVYKKMFIQAAAEASRSIDVTCVANGTEAREHIGRRNYDVVVIDVEISPPGILELLGDIKWKSPKTLVLATTRPSKGGSELCAEALARGAFDFMTKPIYSSYEENVEHIRDRLTDIIDVLRESGKTHPVKPPDGQAAKPPDGRAARPADARDESFKPELVVIAASTGGPLALESIFTALRADYPVPILIVQHIPQFFSETLAGHLDQKTALSVKVAGPGERIKAGTVYLAPGGSHMKLTSKGKIYLDDSPPRNGIRPSADALFESIAEDYKGNGILAVVLTGMGQDGERGIAAMKKKKDCFCIAQSERTCIVYGMPRAVTDNGLADRILDLKDIPPTLESLAFREQ